MTTRNTKQKKMALGCVLGVVVAVLLAALFWGMRPDLNPEATPPKETEPPLMSGTEPPEPTVAIAPTIVDTAPTIPASAEGAEPTIDTMLQVTEPAASSRPQDSPDFNLPATDGVPVNPDGTKGQFPELPGNPDQEPAEDTPDHTHAYTAQQVAPTCEVMGCTLHICSCGHMYYDMLADALGHDFVYDCTVAPGTLTEGYTRFLCSRNGCGQELREDIVPPTGPDYDCESIAAYGRNYAHGLGFTVVSDADISGWYSISNGVNADALIQSEDGLRLLQENICALIDALAAQLQSENPDGFSPERYIITVKVWFFSSAEYGDVYGLGVYGTPTEREAPPPSDGTQDPTELGIPIEEP